MHPLRRIFWPPTATRAERLANTTTMLLIAASILWIIFSIQAVQYAAPRPGPGGNLAPLRRVIYSILGVSGGLMLGGVLSAAIHLALYRRSRRLIQSLNFRLCPRCRYDLSDSPPDGACPECGRAYTVADLQSLWKSAYRL